MRSIDIMGRALGAHRNHRVALVALIVCHGVAHGADPSPAARYRIEQASQPLSESLLSIARQTGVSVLFDPGAVSGRTSRPVAGNLSAAEAILLALDGTGLVAQVMKDGSIVVRAATLPDVSPGVPAPAGPSSLAPSDTPPSIAGAADLRLAQARAEATSDAGAALSASGRDEALRLSKVEVTGSRLKRVEAEGPLPVNVYTRDDIDKSGQPTLERFLGSLNEASVSQGEGTYGPTAGQGTVQLRGLPLGSTLVLINGRRVQAVGSSSANFFNLNLIPMAAVERVEIVPVGSSAVYGGDALAGVVNIILKKSIDGISMDARLATGKGVGDGSVSLATGDKGDNGSYLLLGSYSKTTPLTMAERGFFRDADYRRFGGPDARNRSCTPGTVSSTTAGNLPGLNSTLAGIPAAAPGQPLTLGSFTATDGRPNLCNSIANANGYALVHGTESLGLHAVGERKLGDAWTLFGEMTYTDERLHVEETGLLLSDVLVPASNPHNPFGVPVKVTSRLGTENGMEGLVRHTDFTRALVGLRGDIGAGWDIEAALSTSRDDGTRRLSNNAVNTAARTAALAASSPDAALDPFTAGRAASEDVLRGIWSDSVRQNHGRKDQASVFLRGAVVDLPAGPLEAIAGLEFGRDRYRTSTDGGATIAESRTSSAVFGEFRVPLLRGHEPAGSGWNLAALTIAGRRDHYSDFGGASTYQAGLEVRPTRTVLLRASTATSFKPPTLLQTGVDDQSLSSDLYGLVDPAHANADIVGGEVLRTTNPNLKPEKGRAFSMGAMWEPQDSPGTRLGLTAWRVKVDGLISLLWPQVTLDHESLFPGFVTREPSVGGVPGAVTRVLYSEVNFGGVETAGADLEAAHSWKAQGGRWTVAASATRTTKYDVVIAPGAPVENRLGRRAIDYWAPKWKGRLSTGFDAPRWSVGIAARYLGAYRDTAPSERSLGNYWIFDLSGRLDLKKLGLGFGSAKAANLMLGIVNLANRQPEFVGSAPYYDFTQADWRGRYTSLRLSVDW